jgi:spermidine synthase
VVTYRAPRLTYVPDSSPRDRLIELVTELGVAAPEEWLASPGRDRAFAERLAAYWAARNQFLSSGRDVRPMPRVQEMLARVRDPLLGVLRLSPDFRPAYDPLLAMAATLARTDPAGARALLGELTRLQPARVEASRLLAALSENRKP